MARFGAEQLSDVLEILTIQKPEIVTKFAYPDSGLLAGIRMERFQGPRVYISVMLGTPSGGGHYDPTGSSTTTALATASSPGYIQPQEDHAYVQAIHEITRDIFDGMNTPASLWNTATKVLTQMRDTFQTRLRTVYMGPVKGGTTNIGQLASSNTTVTVDGSEQTVVMDADATADPPSYGAWYLRHNLIIEPDDGSGALPATRTPVQVRSIDRDRKTCKLIRTTGNSASVTTGTIFYPQRIGALSVRTPHSTTAGQIPPTPWSFFADKAGIVHNVDKAASVWWKGSVIDAAGGSTLSGSNIQDLTNEVWGRSLEFSQPEIAAAFTTRQLMQKLRDDYIVNHKQELQRVPPGGKMVFGGYTLQWENIVINEDPFVPPGQFYLPDFDALVRYEYGPPSFERVGPDLLYQHQDNPGLRRAVIIYGTQLTCEWCASQGKIIRMTGDLF